MPVCWLPRPPALSDPFSGGRTLPARNGLNAAPVVWAVRGAGEVGADELGPAEKAEEEENVEGPSSSASLEPKDEVGWKGLIADPPKPVGWADSGAGVEADENEDEKGVDEGEENEGSGLESEFCECPLTVAAPLEPPLPENANSLPILAISPPVLL